jgi:predicted regulator of Ras-like GTPase activity (Roadblock/LC7/MglB family)
MEQILQGLHDLDGVQGAFVCDDKGQMLGHHSRTSLYDQSLFGQVGDVLVKTVESIQLQQPDWEAMTAYFAEGRLLVHNLGKAVLAVVADATLNASFAGVAIRVAVTKLKEGLENGKFQAAAPAPGTQSGNGSAVAPAGPAASAAPGQGSGDPHGLASSGLLQSGLSWSGGTSSGISSSVVAVADTASSDFLNNCMQALARSVGPMAKVFLKEAVRAVSPTEPFSRAMAPQLIAELERHIPDADERKSFRKLVSA